MNRPVLARARLLAFVPALLPACAPKIARFTVVPHHLCSGTPVGVDWEVTGSPRLTTAPPIAPQADRTYAPTATTVFTLEVRRWPGKPKTSQTEAKVVQGTAAGPEADEIPFNLKCEAGALVGTLERPPADWDARIRVGALESGEDR